MTDFVTHENVGMTRRQHDDALSTMIADALIDVKYDPQYQPYHCCAMRNIVGERVVEMSNVQYYFDGEPADDDIGDIELLFDDGMAVTLFVLSDGISVGAWSDQAEVPEPAVTDNACIYSWTKEDLLPRIDARQLSGARIVSTEAMYDAFPGRRRPVLSAWRIVFATGDSLVAYNAGDDFALYLNGFPPTTADDKRTFAPL